MRTRHGFVLAAAGVDASNTEPGTVLLLPLDPDASARRLRELVQGRTGRNVAVVVTDTAGRAWRNGQTDLALGAAGIDALDDHAGRVDAWGNELAVTEPAVIDELAAAADLVKGKLGGIPFALVRGLSWRVLPPGEHGAGARPLVRDRSHDMFGIGSREAVLAALAGVASPFGASAPYADLAAALESAVGPPTALVTLMPTARHDLVVLLQAAHEGDRGLGYADAVVAAVATAHGWVVDATLPSPKGALNRRLVARRTR